MRPGQPHWLSNHLSSTCRSTLWGKGGRITRDAKTKKKVIRIRARALSTALAVGSGPAIVIAQAGQINTGDFDPVRELARICRKHADAAKTAKVAAALRRMAREYQRRAARLGSGCRAGDESASASLTPRRRPRPALRYVRDAIQAR